MSITLLKEERQQLIWELLQKDGKVTVTELSQRYSASEVTIRRDLAELAEQGKLTRSHRGALVATPSLSADDQATNSTLTTRPSGSEASASHTKFAGARPSSVGRCVKT
ncbi:MAG: DeoR family transcriptional regulator [Chloroflexi bacterium]|nr:DeoR family transcriptional regulator [Chloroflexota bacterium]